MSESFTVWRIAPDTPWYQAQDLSGKGAQDTGGRWNRKGSPVVYTSVSRALACLETVVHLSGGDALPLNRYLVKIDIPAALWKSRVEFDPVRHVGWDAEPSGKVSMNWGTAWIQGKSSVLAQVPSVIVPEECNFLINPRHPDAAKIIGVKVRKWTYDQRIKLS
ncbi:MAG: RES family NAD+ phosphorylase [Burkholderiales bacterium]